MTLLDDMEKAPKECFISIYHRCKHGNREVDCPLCRKAAYDKLSGALGRLFR